MLTDVNHSEQHARARDRGYQSSIALPLTIEGRTIGGISIYAREPDAFLGTLALGMTMGQLLCLPMFLFGLFLLLRKGEAFK